VSRAVVIGGGFGGIAAALRARAKGYSVTIVDRCARLGGRAQLFEQGGYRHDAGPTVITAPFLIKELFDLFDYRADDFIKIVPLSPWYRFYYADGGTFDYGGTIEETISEIRRIAPDDADGYQRMLDHSRAIHDVGFSKLAHTPFHKFSFMMQQVPALVRLGAYRTVWGFVCRYLKNDKLRQAFSIQPLLVGGNPFDTTSIYALIHFLERAHGVHFIMGGTAALVDGLANLCQRVGIVTCLGETVTGIETSAGAVSGVVTDTQRRLTADVVISNADPAYVYPKLLKSKEIKSAAKLKVALHRKSMGLFVLYFGTKRQFPTVAHHTIWLGHRYQSLLNDIFNRKILPDDFSLYLHRPTATDPSFAPTGHDSFYVLAPVPNLNGGVDWSTQAPLLRDRIITALDQTILPGLKRCIAAPFFMTPQDFADEYLSPAGAGFSIAPSFRQSAWFRFHNRGEGPRGLYLVGAGTHPGAGLPGVISSAKVVEGLLPPAQHASHPPQAA
jgi:phytoene desaturase